MKKLIFIFALCAIGFLCESAFTQVKYKINISSQPIWGPVGYDYVENYYLPDIDVYYYVKKHKFIYLQNGKWISRSYLTATYNLYNCRKVVINEPKPYLHHRDNKEKYALAVDHSNQISIRDSHEPKYFENKDHPEHNKWKDFKKNKEQQQKLQAKYSKTQLSIK